MIAGPYAISLKVEVNRNACSRALGYPANRHPPARVARRLEEMLPLARSLLEPRGALAIGDRSDGRRIMMPAPSRVVGVGVATIGPGIEDESRRRTEAGEILDGLILDAIGSVAAEAAADELNRELCDIARTADGWAGPRASPGFGRWGIEGQAMLLDFARATEIGIVLTPGLMMVPRKSVSFAVRFRMSRPDSKGPACRRCGLAGCIYRKE